MLKSRNPLNPSCYVMYQQVWQQTILIN